MPKRKVATGSTRDVDWQREEYERLMGKEAAERQEHAVKTEHGECTCRHFTLRTRQGYRTVHRRECVKFKPWMEEHLARSEGNPKGDAYVRSMR